MGDIIEEGIMQLKISEYHEIELEELTREPLYFTSNTKHVHNQHVLILHCRCNRVFIEPSKYLVILRFLRAVAYRWLARWLFGPMGWENTRPLPSCIYHRLRSELQTHETTGYVSGQERAEQND